MFLSPCWEPLLGKGSKAPPGSIGRSSVASRRSCGDPAGLGPTSTCRRTSDIAWAESKRFPSSEELEPQPARTSPASSSAARLSGLLALPLDARLGGDRRHRGLVMAAGTIPD